MTLASFQELIERKRDGYEHTAAEIERIVLGFTRGDVPDYQMSAWLMAAFLRGLSAEETVWMTDAMVRSGRVLDLSAVPGTKVDKHSTGGVADTTTLVVAPLAAACGAKVAKMSGRGLGHTGGTLDKLAAVPGFRVDLTPEEFVRQVGDIGLALMAQNPDVVPADKKIYALRDVTGTVPFVPFLVSSIISKKVAGGADAIVLDVKTGSGAFMKTLDDARFLAGELERVGRALGRTVEVVITSMEQPLGTAIGNALEVGEAIQTLRAEGPADLTELCLVLVAKMLVHAQIAENESSGRVIAEAALADGRGLAKFAEWVEAQGGDPRIADNPALLPQSSTQRELRAPNDGYVAAFDAEGVGRAAMALGAGRQTAEDEIDPAAGIVLAVRVGDRIERGDLLATLHAANEPLIQAGYERLFSAIDFSETPVTPPPLFPEA